MNDCNANQNTPTPQELVATENLLEQLAAQERRAAPPGFEERLAAATSQTFLASVEAPALLASIGPGRLRVWRLAAAVALAGAGVLGAMWLSGRGPSGPSGGAPVAQRPESASQSTLESELASVGTELASLMASDEALTSSGEDMATLESELAALEDELADLGMDQYDTLLEESL